MYSPPLPTAHLSAAATPGHPAVCTPPIANGGIQEGEFVQKNKIYNLSISEVHIFSCMRQWWSFTVCGALQQRSIYYPMCVQTV